MNQEDRHKQQVRTFYPKTFIETSRGYWATLLSIACALSVVMAATGCATDNDTTPRSDRSDDIASDGGDGVDSVDIQDTGVVEHDATVDGEDSNEDSVSPLDDIEDNIQVPDPFEQPDFSISISSDVLIEHVNQLLGFHFGVPVARHVLTSVGACRVICNQEILGATCRPLMMWSDDTASVQWIGVSWSGRIKASSCTLEVVEENVATDTSPLISAVDGVYTIDTGGQTALLDPTSSDVLLEDIGGISGTAMRLQLVDTEGSVYTGEVTSTNLVVNDASTSILHLQGDYVRADPPSTFNAFEVRIYANAGAAHLGLEHKLIVTSDAIQTREIASLTVEISGTTPSSNPDTDLLFDAVDHARLTVGTSVSDFEHKVGALEVTTDGYTLGLGLRHAHEEYPKRLTTSSPDEGFRLVADLWPIKDGDKALIDTHPKGLRNELKDVDKWFCVGALDFILNVNGIPAEPCLDWVTATEAEKLDLVAQLAVYPDAPVILSDFVGDISQLDDFVETCGDLCTSRWMIYDSRGDYRRTAQGIAKTHWLAVSAIPGTVEPIIGAVDAEPFVRIAPEYIASTEVFGRYFPATEGRFEDIESFIEEAYGALQGDAPPLYGVLRNGVHYNQHAKTVLATAHSENNEPEKYLGFYNQEAHDIVDMLWWRYLRTGSRASYVEAIRSSRYTADLLTVWDYAEPGRVGLQRRHSLYPWSDISPSHTLTGGVLTAHLLSGLNRYRDAVILGGQAALAHYSEDSGLFSALPVAAYPEVANSGTSLRGHTALWHSAMN
ncbi:MAG: hypothetical protein VX223_09585, partial [Myxococcota bacterium]|nr:hypothetical protein [Myxococcota bacterium]